MESTLELFATLLIVLGLNFAYFVWPQLRHIRSRSEPSKVILQRLKPDAAPQRKQVQPDLDEEAPIQ